MWINESEPPAKDGLGREVPCPMYKIKVQYDNILYKLNSIGNETQTPKSIEKHISLKLTYYLYCN